MSTYYNLNTFTNKTENAIKAFRNNLSTIHTGHATVSMVDRIAVLAYDKITFLPYIASISILEQKIINIDVWDSSLVKKVAKALVDANIGMSATINGNVLQLRVPSMTTERREFFIKKSKTFAETARVAVRQIRQDDLNLLKRNVKDGIMQGHLMRSLSSKVQEATNASIEKINEILEEKIVQLSQV